MDRTVEPMNIGRAAERSGVSARMIRHYEGLGLLPKAHRSDAGYRRYGDNDVHALRFIRHARDLGFSVAEIAELLALWHDQHRASADVKRIAQHHVQDLDRRIDDLVAMKRTLERLVHSCHGDERSPCPILDELADKHGEPAQPR